MVTISKENAEELALILSSGAPLLDALPYVAPGLGGRDLAEEGRRWITDPLVAAAILKYQGKAWERMSLEERITYAINKHYTEAAYFLFSRNYCELAGHERTKADTCRSMLEAKLAGMSGKLGALETFWRDVIEGKVKGVKTS